MSKKVVIRSVLGVAVVLAVGGAATYVWLDYSQAQNALANARLDVRSLGENIERHPEDVPRLKEMCSLAKINLQCLETFCFDLDRQSGSHGAASRIGKGPARHRPACRRRREAKILRDIRRLDTPADAMTRALSRRIRSSPRRCRPPSGARPTAKTPRRGREIRRRRRIRPSAQNGRRSPRWPWARWRRRGRE